MADIPARPTQDSSYSASDSSPGTAGSPLSDDAVSGSLSQLSTAASQGNVQLGEIARRIGGIWPISGDTATTATAGSATLPSNPVGFLVVTLPSGLVVIFPYYAQ